MNSLISFIISVMFFFTNSATYMIPAKTEQKLTGNEDFRGYVDVDMDGIPEKIYTNGMLRVYNLDDELLFSFPLKNYDDINYNCLPIWTVYKDNLDKNIHGEIIYKVMNIDDNFYKMSYTIIDGKIVMDDNEYQEMSEPSLYVYNGDGSITYAGSALDYSDADYLSGKALVDFHALHEQAEKVKVEDGLNYTAILDVTNGERRIFAYNWGYGDELINGIPVDFSAMNVMLDIYIGDYDKAENEAYNPFTFFTSTGPGVYENIVPVFITKDDEFYYPMTENGIGQTFDYYDDNHLIIASERRYGDAFTDEIDGEYVYISEVTLHGEEVNYFQNITAKPYWFYFDGKEFYEYGGIEISIETFKNIPNGKVSANLIEANDGEITDIYYRENGIINVNYRVKADNEGVYLYFYKNYEYLEDGSINEIDSGNGIYLPSILEELDVDTVSYPENFPLNT